LIALSAAASAAETPDCSRPAGDRPDPSAPAGTPNEAIPIQHVFVIMQENHSFDNFFGRLNVNGYEGQVDGVVPETMGNPDTDGSIIHPFHLGPYCVKDTEHSWNASHLQYDEGRMDGFIQTNNGAAGDGYRAMGYYDQADMPYLYALANRFAIGDRYFSSVLGPTYPNRYYMYTATSFGTLRNRLPAPFVGNNQKTIFDVLSENGISWRYYYTDVPAIILLQPTYWKHLGHIRSVLEYKHDLHRKNLPSVIFVEQSMLAGDEHPPGDFQTSQHAVAKRINQLLDSPYWDRSVLFLTYDEHGGYYDHVAPPPACAPDEIPPELDGTDTFNARFDRYGMRVPFVAVSPYVRRHYVSHVTYDHTSILRFIETKFNLPALTRRDANADPMLDLFDFEHPDASVPRLPPAAIDWKKFLECFTRKGREIPRPAAATGTAGT
jgi:phospholipase C